LQRAVKEIWKCSTTEPGEMYHMPLRLRGAERSCSGRLEVYHNAVGGSICDDQWDIRDAEVVCRQLGCGKALRADGSAAFGAESTLKNCRSAGWGEHYCDHGEDAGVICSDSVRLVNGGSRCAGRVEVLYEGQWGTVCSFGWDMRDAAVVCRELSCGKAVDAVRNAHFGPGPVLKGFINCGGSESTLNECFIGHNNDYCESNAEDAGVICSDSVRLVDGGGRCSGRVEVLHRGQWGTVCGAGWDMRDAAVVCRELGCGEAVDAVYNAHFGPGSRPIWMDEVTCSGSESTLKNCRSAGWGKHNYWSVVLAVLGEWRYFLGRPGPQCVMLTLTSRMQRLCVESWVVGLLWRCWEQLLLAEGRARCGQRSFSVEATNLRFTLVKQHLHPNTVPMIMMWD
uniref:SRCR domain-containing protein n=1 Tax=Electrophorus electricus TaxID=8005 RepID=A0AAY5EUU6_ELEEL